MSGRAKNHSAPTVPRMRWNFFQQPKFYILFLRQNVKSECYKYADK